MPTKKKLQRIEKIILKKLGYLPSIEQQGTPAHFVQPKTPNALKFPIKNSDGSVTSVEESSR